MAKASVNSGLIGVPEAAKALGFTPRHVRNLIADGFLPAERMGRDFLIRHADLAKVPKDRKPGPKAKK
jgi:excisionase family DNA binding protein